jgi:lipopolysaccharide biosynthesis regulator YciM
MERNAVSQNYLDRVLEVAEEFHEIREIIGRYDTLTSTHEDLVERGQLNQDKMDAAKRQLMLYVEEKTNEILNFNNRLAALQTRLDKAQSQAVKWESKWNHIQNTAARKSLLLGRIKMAVQNLYQVVSQHQRLSSIDDEPPVEDTSEQLVKVKEYIEDLAQITQEIRRQDTQLTSVIASSSY